MRTIADSDVLNVREAAAFLRVHIETLRRLARRGGVPAFKVGKDWRFQRDALLRWAGKPGRAPESPSVVIVDDDPSVGELLGQLVEEAGFRAIVVATGSEGLGLVSAEPPALVLLDLLLPDLRGPEFLQELRKTQPDLPVVIVTGYPDGDLMHRAMQFGPILVLAKPIDEKHFAKAIRMVMGKAAAIKTPAVEVRSV